MKRKAEDSGDRIDPQTESQFQGRDFHKLRKPPTSQELITLKETENLFHSSLFRLQVKELLSEVKFSHQESIEVWIANFKRCLLGLPSEEPHDINNQKWMKELTLQLPLCQQHYDGKGMFRFLPPDDVNVVGSYPLGLSCKPDVKVHLAVQMPKECFHHVDYLNHRYPLKRAMYLLCLAHKLQQKAFVQEMKYSYFHGDHLKPVLLISPSGKLSKKVTFCVLLHPPSDFFNLSRFVPQRNNIRPSWFFQQQQINDAIPTPRYNSSILVDLTLEQNFKHIASALSMSDGIKDALILMKVWSRQRQLDKGFGSFTPFIQTMFMMYLLQSKRITSLMSSYQVLRTVWLNLAQNDWTVKGISLSQRISQNQPSLEDFHSAFQTVFVDLLGFQNICANMAAVTFCMVQYESAMAVKCLDIGNSGAFDALFMTPVPFILKFDHVLCISDSGTLRQACEKLDLSQSLLDNAGNTSVAIIPKLVEFLQNGLGKRIQLLGVQLKRQCKWSVRNSAPSADNFSGVFVGFLLDSNLSSSILDKGPPAESLEALMFQEFWGEKSELRRFQDGSICEAVVWPGCTVSEKRMVCKHIVMHILSRHLFITKSAYIGDEIESIISMAAGDSPSEITNALNYGTCEEQTVAALQAFDKLIKHIRKLDVVLSINSAQGISPVFRYTGVFSPSPFTGNVNKRLERINGSVVGLKGNVHFSRPSCKSLEAILQLESSGKWPDDVDAIQRLKAAFVLRMTGLLEKEHGLTCVPHEEFMDVFFEGFVFRLKIACQQEVSALQHCIMPNGTVTMQSTPESFALEMRTEILPKVTSALHGLQMQHSSYSPACQLAKRWVSAQLLLDHVSDVCIDLIVANLYSSSLPFTPPSCPQVGFLRFLQLVSKFDWKNQPLIVNLNNELKEKAIADIQTEFLASRKDLPAMYIATPYNNCRSHWSKNNPTHQILHRLVSLAAEAKSELESQLMNPVADFDYKIIFRPPLDPYDVIIHLNLRHVTTLNLAVDAACSKRFYHLCGSQKLKSEAMPIVDYNPVNCYIKELHETFGEYALFFYDRYGGKYIAVLWKPAAFEPQQMKVANVNGRLLCPNSTDGNGLLAPNVAAIIEDFSHLGQGIIHTIETKTEKWTFD